MRVAVSETHARPLPQRPRRQRRDAAAYDGGARPPPLGRRATGGGGAASLALALALSGEPRASAVAAGGRFSLVVLAEGHRRGELLYWGSGPPGAGGTRNRELPATSAQPFGRWAHRFRRDTFLRASASGVHALALTDGGALLSWRHGVEQPVRLGMLEPAPVSAIAAGLTVGLVVSPAYDVRAPPPPPQEAPLLATPAPFPRPVLTRGSNIGIAQLLSARPDALALSLRDANRSFARTPCWSAAAPRRACPLARAADCDAWQRLASPPATAGGAPRCLPAALLLGGAGCGVDGVGRLLARHPSVVVPRALRNGNGAAARLRPWWSYPTLSAFSAAMGEGAAARVAAAPEASLLLQWDTLDASSVGLADGGAGTASLRAATSHLPTFPRVQPDLRVLVLVCDPARRPATARRPALRAMRRAFERCADGARRRVRRRRPRRRPRRRRVRAVATRAAPRAAGGAGSASRERKTSAASRNARCASSPSCASARARAPPRRRRRARAPAAGAGAHRRAAVAGAILRGVQRGARPPPRRRRALPLRLAPSYLQ